MNGGFPPHDLECPNPSGCTVAVKSLVALAGQGRLPSTRFSATTHWYRVYDAQDGYGQPNPGFGDTRFAPFDALHTGERVPTFYLADSLAAALLETSLHDVHENVPRIVSERALLGKLHARIVPPDDLHMVDLRDEQLDALGLSRPHVASSSAEHYPCTRTVARAIHGSPQEPAGIVWHSRQAELSKTSPSEVAVVFADRVSHARGAWSLGLHRHAAGSLLEGAGRLTLDELAESLGVTVSVDDDLT